MDANEIYSTQEEIIEMQSKIIYGLYKLLGQYVAADELDGLPETEVINSAARMRERLERQEGGL